MLRLRRLVIGEVPRFPDLAQALWDAGPERAIRTLANLVQQLADLGLLHVTDAEAAATHLNWLMMSGPLNKAMLLGDDTVPDSDARSEHATEAVRIFLAAYSP